MAGRGVRGETWKRGTWGFRGRVAFFRVSPRCRCRACLLVLLLAELFPTSLAPL
jgi:hypothetical protein